MRAFQRTIISALCGAFCVVAPASADEPAPFRDFTFKKVQPPKRGSKKKRITTQITADDLERQRGKSTSLLRKEPSKPKETTASTATQKTGDKSQGTYAWYWGKVSPHLGEKSPGRLRSALVALDKGPAGKSVAGPRLDVLKKIVAARGTDILRATIGTEVSPALALAVISIESGGQADAKSHAGAQGLMQLMPATAERFGVKDPLVAADNIKGGVAYLDLLMKEFDRDPILVLASYNAGENAVRRAGGVPDYAETRDYVPKVLAAYKTARALCLTPPELMSDGCVFNIKLASAKQ